MIGVKILQQVIKNRTAIAPTRFKDTLSVCRLASTLSNEPAYMVREDDKADPAGVKLPYLSEKMRADIFLKYKSNPATWSVNKLAEKYGASLDRIKAVIFLMDKRCKVLESDLRKLAPFVEDPDILCAGPFETAESLLHPVFPVPPLLSQVYAVYLADRTVDLEVLVGQYNTLLAEQKHQHANSTGFKKLVQRSGDTDAQSDSDKLGPGALALKEAFKLIEQHEHRLKDLMEYNSYMSALVQRYRDAGVDVSRFRETGGQKKARSGPVEVGQQDSKARSAPPTAAASTKEASGGIDIPQSLIDRYYPDLISDDEVSSAEQRLLRRIAAETQASTTPRDFQFHHDRFDSPPTISEAAEVGSEKSSTETELVEDAINDLDTFSGARWKLAFRDLAQDRSQRQGQEKKRGNEQSSDGMAVSTLICTRSGR